VNDNEMVAITTGRTGRRRRGSSSTARSTRRTPTPCSPRWRRLGLHPSSSTSSLVAFLDSSGIRAIDRGHRHLTADGRAFYIVSPRTRPSTGRFASRDSARGGSRRAWMPLSPGRHQPSRPRHVLAQCRRFDASGRRVPAPHSRFT
jgi:hypothetical protein